MLRKYLLGLAVCLGALACQAQTASTSQLQSTQDTGANGTLRLRQAPAAGDANNQSQGQGDFDRNGMRRNEEPLVYQPGEFERFVQRLVDAGPNGPNSETRQADGSNRADKGDQARKAGTIRRFGAELMTDMDDRDLQSVNPLVPADYLLTPGDELVVTLWGSVDADLRLMIDRSGRVTIPRVGPVMLAGVRYADAPEVIRRRVAQVFRNFDVSVSLGQLRGIRVYVTGYVARPGAYSVSSLATTMQALIRAGGPSAAGSFRQIELRRRGQAPVTLDLYDFLLRGDRSADVTLMADDVIHVAPVGTQVAVIGSVNKPAIFELKPGEGVGDALRMAGGFDAVADRSRVALERLSERTTVRVAEIRLPEGENMKLSYGDVLHAFSAVDVTSPILRQAKRVRVDGEVAQPGEYVLPAGSTVSDALKAAGGLTPLAFVYGTEFTRESVRVTQQENYDRALRDLETEFTKANTTQRTSNSDEAAAQQSKAANTSRLIEQLRAVRPTGRIVLQLAPNGTQLPDLALENGDRLYVPPRPTTVGVFGSVFNGGSYLFGEGRSLSEYLRLAGGPTKGADASSTFVIRANGSVVSGRQSSGWFGSNDVEDISAQPGDTIFVPEEVNKTTFIQNAKDWTQILYQFGLGIAAIHTLK